MAHAERRSAKRNIVALPLLARRKINYMTIMQTVRDPNQMERVAHRTCVLIELVD